jgi:hypothetical protein
VTFTPADDWLLGEEPSLLNSFGVAVGDLSGNGLMDIAMAGGAPEGTAPTLCFQGLPRRFLCSRQLVSIADGAWQDLLMVADIDADGHNELFVRERTITVLKTHQSPADALSIDLRDSQGHRNLQGHALVARCAADDSLVGLRTIDGGNGYMSQGNYVVSFESDWCMQLVVSTPIGGRLETIGTFSLGRHVAYLPD